ncbi:uncharacterized protein LOC119998135 isoform X2 [Tripterygium wilfordii]|uniref:uncharacterized protein LOC119998135 isoform X2 n=1 Tax=Tripterygium wilfordii TaxID=458696 RepID=UPI0018F7E57D|nr:uncharacterized protein LOC119998135 isoform X2 [Tripterygium wilfordii]
MVLVWHLQVDGYCFRTVLDFGEDCLDEGESDDENAESGEECASESEVDDENDASSEEERTSSNEGRTDCSDDDGVDVEATAEAALKKLVLPFKSEDFEKSVLGEPEMSESTKSETVEPSNNSKRPLRKDAYLVDKEERSTRLIKTELLLF